MTNMTELIAAAQAWRAQDPDPNTREALDQLLVQVSADDGAVREPAVAELTDAFAGPLEFGTAGLRGPLGPGPARMNRVVVTQAAAGFAEWLKANGHAGGRVIVGFDARYNSDVFAQDTAEVMTAAGFEVILTGQPTPTPVVAFGIQHYGCVAGVVVTASTTRPTTTATRSISATVRRSSRRPIARSLPRSQRSRQGRSRTWHGLRAGAWLTRNWSTPMSLERPRCSLPMLRATSSGSTQRCMGLALESWSR